MTTQPNTTARQTPVETVRQEQRLVVESSLPVPQPAASVSERRTRDGRPWPVITLGIY